MARLTIGAAADTAVVGFETLGYVECAASCTVLIDIASSARAVPLAGRSPVGQVI